MMTTGGGLSLTLMEFLCACMMAQSAEVSVSKCNSVLFGWPVLGPGQFVGQFVQNKDARKDGSCLDSKLRLP